MSTTLDETLNVEEETVVENSIDLDEVIEVENPTADFNIPATPPKAGIYVARWKLNSQKPNGGIEAKNSPKVGNFLNVHLLGVIVAPDESFDGFIFNDYMHTIVNRQKGTSEVHHFLNCLGTPLDKSTSLRQIMTTLQEELSLEPTSKVKIEWKATYKDDNGKYIDIAKKMTDFEKLPDGTYQNWKISPLDGERVYAQVYVVQHILPNG